MLKSKRVEETDSKNERRDTSKTSRTSSAQKYLKRKPDHKKLIQGLGSKKKKENRFIEYYHSQLMPQIEKPKNEELGLYSDIQKEIKDRQQTSHEDKTRNYDTARTLETVRSDGNLRLRKKQSEIPIIDVGKEKNSKDNSYQGESYNEPKIVQKMIFGPSQSLKEQSGSIYCPRVNLKKSKSQKFLQEDFHYQSMHSSINPSEDIYELNQSRQTDKTKNFKKAAAQVQKLLKQNQYLKQKIERYQSNQNLFRDKHKHCQEIIKAKQRQIQLLTREKAVLSQKIKFGCDQRLKQTLLLLQKELRSEQQRIVYLKQQNTFLETQLLAKNQEMTDFYKEFKHLERSYKDYQRKMVEKIQTMKVEAVRQSQKVRSEILEVDSYGQIQKWKQKVVSQQEEIKYLKIQNQCLLISKEELKKSQMECRKLKEERDYFKKKVLENAKRTKQLWNDMSMSSSSLLLELSQISIQR